MVIIRTLNKREHMALLLALKIAIEITEQWAEGKHADIDFPTEEEIKKLKEDPKKLGPLRRINTHLRKLHERFQPIFSIFLPEGF